MMGFAYSKFGPTVSSSPAVIFSAITRTSLPNSIAARVRDL